MFVLVFVISHNLIAYPPTPPSSPPSLPPSLLPSVRGHPKLVEAIQLDLPRIDFSAAQAVLLPSVPGKHTGRDKSKYGHLKLRRLLEQEHIPPELFAPPSLPSSSSSSTFRAHWQNSSSSLPPSLPPSTGIIAQFSSLGSHANNGQWVTQEFERSLLSSSSLPPSSSSSCPSYLIWPRRADVDASLEGRAAGGAIPCPPKNVFVNKPLSEYSELNTIHPYLRERLSRWEGGRWGRQRAMPHIKSFLRFSTERGREGGREGGGGGGGITRLAWMLMTSHNYSKPAW